MTRPHAPLRLAVVGFGAIGQALAQELAGDERVCLAQVIVSPRSLAAAQAACAGLRAGAAP
jgi:aspartate dehydrogenase